MASMLLGDSDGSPPSQVSGGLGKRPKHVTYIAGCGPVFVIARQDLEDPDWTGVWPSAILYNRFLRTTGSGGLNLD